MLTFSPIPLSLGPRSFSFLMGSDEEHRLVGLPIPPVVPWPPPQSKTFGGDVSDPGLRPKRGGFGDGFQYILGRRIHGAEILSKRKQNERHRPERRPHDGRFVNLHLMGSGNPKKKCGCACESTQPHGGIADGGGPRAGTTRIDQPGGPR